MEVIGSPKVYPVIVVGSGVSGGMAAWNLTRQGIEVCLLDAGDKFDRSKNPTLTILAISWRSTGYLAEEIKKGSR
jgi:choline dehydrogenase-like flavoprotein